MLSVRIGRWALRAVAAGVILAGCSQIPLDRSRLTSDGVVERMQVSVPAAEVAKGPRCGRARLSPGGKDMVPGAARGAPAAPYRVGPGDTLRLNIFGEDGLSDVSARIDSEGFVQLPIIELVQVAGKSTREILGLLKTRYSEHFNEPWLTVEVEEAGSAPIYFLGEFREPGVRYMNGSTNLIEALALGGGLEEDAYLPGARLIRGEQVCTVDLNALLKNGRFDQNVWIAPRDVIFAPRKEDMQVYVIGAVGSPQAVSFGAEGRTLLQALTIAGGPDLSQAQLAEVRVVRAFSPTTGELIVVDARKMLAGEALDFPLALGDVVFVPETPLASWNGSLAQILPSLQVLGGILTPITLIQALGE